MRPLNRQADEAQAHFPGPKQLVVGIWQTRFWTKKIDQLG
jgi:hypothetical protein